MGQSPAGARDLAAAALSLPSAASPEPSDMPRTHIAPGPGHVQDQEDSVP
ncbi:hypothetical protein [Candidatus Corynebacterium faecigallinarum]